MLFARCTLFGSLDLRFKVVSVFEIAVNFQQFFSFLRVLFNVCYSLFAICKCWNVLKLCCNLFVITFVHYTASECVCAFNKSLRRCSVYRELREFEKSLKTARNTQTENSQSKKKKCGSNWKFIGFGYVSSVNSKVSNENCSFSEQPKWWSIRIFELFEKLWDMASIKWSNEMSYFLYWFWICQRLSI